MTTDTSTTDPPAAPLPPGPGVAPDGTGVPARSPAPRPVAAYLAAGAAYLVLAVAIWWNVWSGHPTSTATSLSGDGPLFTWFLEWPAYALAHGLDPLYSTALFHPGGINLLANTGVVGIGVVLAPVTWAFGPVATLNLAVTLSPVLSGLAMFALLRRWVAWTPAAFAGGLCYGFSPFVLAALADDHLMFGFAALPPLIVACLDELLVRRRRRPGPTGVVLGLLVTAQFFVGTEALVMTAVGCLVGIVLLAGFTAVRRPEEFRRHRRRAAVGLGSGAATALVLLAYPVWFALAGPAHFSGPIWPGLDLPHGGTSLHLLAFPQSRAAVVAGRGIYGLFYEGPLWSYEYVGLGLIAVVVVGAAVWWRDALIRLFGSVAVVSVVLSLGESHSVALPWALLAGLPIADDIIPDRFLSLTWLCLAVLLAVIVDRTHSALRQDPVPGPAGTVGRPRWAAPAAGVAVALVALGPLAAYLAPDLPLVAQPAVVPTWWEQVAPTVDSRSVVLALPAPFTSLQGAMLWQAVNRMGYAQVGGGGPGIERPGSEAAGQVVLARVSFSFTPPLLGATDPTAVRSALDGWGVTTVVVPDQVDLPPYDQIPSVPVAVALLTAATGEAPVRRADAWVWTDVRHAPAPVHRSAATFAHCTAGVPAHGPTGGTAVARCVLAAPPVAPN